MGQLSLVLPRHAPPKEEPSFEDGRFDALASCLFLRAFAYERAVRWVHCRRWKPMALRRTWCLHRSELGEVFRAEGPRHTPVRQCVSITSAFSMRTFRLSGAVAIAVDSPHFLITPPYIFIPRISQAIRALRSHAGHFFLCVFATYSNKILYKTFFFQQKLYYVQYIHSSGRKYALRKTAYLPNQTCVW